MQEKTVVSATVFLLLVELHFVSQLYHDILSMSILVYNFFDRLFSGRLFSR